jgi:hypothetical protein
MPVRFLRLSLILVLCLTPLAAHSETTSPRLDTDYADADNWAAVGSAPQAGAPNAGTVDVFFVYPTVYGGKAPVASVDDPAMRAAARGTLKTQAAVFTHEAELYAPFYRQAGMAILGADPLHKAHILGPATYDVSQALNHYLRTWNQGRPFILAGHSQGSNILAEVVKTVLADEDLAERLVAAYLIGWSITAEDLADYPFLSICEEPDDTGCIVTYNSVAPGRQPDAPTVLPGAACVNPLSWTTDGAPVAAAANPGAAFFDEGGNMAETVPGFTGAQVVDGAVVVQPEDPGRLTHMPFGSGVYHAYDYALFWDSLKADVTRRVRLWRERN